jgi:small subunit ribosomal protein S20
LKEFAVANHKSAKKRAKQTVTKTLRNKVKTSESRTVIKALRNAISAKNKEEASVLLPKVQRILGKMASKGMIKKNNMARRTSRLTQQVKNI